MKKPLAQMRCAVAALMLVGGASAHAGVAFDISFVDPGAVYSTYYADLQRNVVAAGNDWANHFALTTNATLSVQIGFAAVPTANGASVTSSFVRNLAGIDIFEEGAAAELRTGLDPNGAAPDIRFTVGITGYLQNQLWFDPDPVAQTALVPDNKIDARSVFLHEFGHALGFNGWRNGVSGTLPGNYASSFDALTTLNPAAAGGATQYFTGAAATSVYGGPVPLTFNNWGHLGNSAPRDGSGLIGTDGDLMNGIVFYYGTRYQISALDLAIMQDLGLPTGIPAVPEPASLVLMLLGVAAVAARARKS